MADDNPISKEDVKKRKDPRIDRSAVTRVGKQYWHWSDTYHTILTLSWPRFFLLVFGVYMVVNLIFATLYSLVPGTIVNARPDSLVDLFFFSIETLATVGYGVMSPATVYGHVIASTEIVLGMLVTAVLTGLLFARFSRPTARVLFSRVMVVTKFNGVSTLMVRAGNERNNLILEASVRATLIRRERTLEGETFYRFYDLKLDRERSSAFALSWTIIHKIDETSPLHGKTAEDLLLDEALFHVAISGQDETLNDTVHARQSYEPEDIIFGSHFADILFERESGKWALDFTKFHDVKADQH
ncbi:MAG TPA: ion channel [Burkholderiaceae bacterium]|jgi:inward rectifier potassium channel